MAKICSFASWNVEHFHGRPDRVRRIAELLSVKDPDIFAIYEVSGRQVYRDFTQLMPSHGFTLTENTQMRNMEILIGVRRSIPSFISQREEFKAKVPSLRPGVLATLQINSEEYPFLFLHTKSFARPRDWGLRDDMFRHVARLKRRLDKQSSTRERANLICLGDLNTMGLNAPYNDVSDLSAEQELAFVSKRMQSVKMHRLSKNYENSWWNGKDTYDPAGLDQVFADDQLHFKMFDGKEIEVVGWPEERTKTKQRRWIDAYSDHALIYGELHS